MVDAVSVMAEFRQSRILGLLPETFSGGITSNYTYTDGRLTSYPQNEATTTVAYDASSGSGDDSLTGGSGADVLDGGSGVDSIDGGSGSDTCELEPTRVDCEKDVTASSDPGEGGAPDETVIGRVYDGDGLLTTVSITHPDLTVDSYQLTWDRTLSVPQIVSFTDNGVSTTLVYGVNRAFGVGSTGTATSFEYSVLGDTTAGPLTVSSGFDPYGQPDTPDSTTVGFGYRGELHVGDSVYLRFRNLDPTLGRFTTVDPIEGVPGTTTVANQYAYAGNDPVAMVDPWGLRPGDSDFGVDSPAIPPDLVGVHRQPSPADAILSAMKFDVQSEVAQRIRGLNSLGPSGFGAIAACVILLCPPFAVAAIPLWVGQVNSGGPWDYKSQIRELQQGFNFWPLDVRGDLDVYFDVWTNIHFGYVGASVGFSLGFLQFGADLGRRFPILQGIVGDNDPSDTLSITIGYRLWTQYGQSLTHAQLVAAVRQAKPEYELAVRDEIEEGPVRVRDR